MPRTYRLTVADLKAFRPVRRLHGTLFSLGIAPAANVRAACVVSKKVSPRAVGRNLIKRRARAILSPLLPDLPAAHYVFYAKKEALHADFSSIKNDLSKMCERARA